MGGIGETGGSPKIKKNPDPQSSRIGQISLIYLNVCWKQKQIHWGTCIADSKVIYMLSVISYLMFK